jgi:hypothetical protein
VARSTSARRAALLLTAVSLAAGCSGLTSVGLGYTSSPSGQPGRQGGALNAYYGAGPSPNAGLSLGLRTKFTENVQHVAISVDGYLTVPTDSFVIPMVRLGANFLQFEGVDGDFAFGMFSPFIEGGVAFLLDWVSAATKAAGLGEPKTFGGPFLSLTGAAEYVVRFSDARNEFWWSALINLGFVFGAEEL